jgi:AraC-like DNA-binding protein/quercetin dioxygenase-like cupin family protein
MAHEPQPIPGVEFCGEWITAKKPYRLAHHRNTGLEIVLVTKGELRWEIENREVHLRANTLFYTLPWQAHGGVEEMQPSCEIFYLCLMPKHKNAKSRRRFQFHPALGFTPAEERTISSALLGWPAQAVPAGSEEAWLFHHFFRVAREPGPLRQGLVRDTIKLIVASLARLAARGRNPDSRLFGAERRVRQFLDTFAPRHAEPWTLESMSEACRLGRTQFSQLLKKQTGDTPVTYLNRTRLREAQRLLGQSQKSITEIALEVGYNSSQYFATVFKEFTGLDPRTFRAQTVSQQARKGN